jgi:hypothetical protein
MAITKVEDLLKEKEFPKWFSDHPVFKEIKTITKIFPKIGLSNCEEDMNAERKENVVSARSLLRKFNSELLVVQRSLGTFKNDENAAKHKKIITLLRRDLTKNKEGFISIKDNIINLSLPDDVILPDAKKSYFRAGESIFKVYNKIADSVVNYHHMYQFEHFTEFKQFSQANIPNKLKIVFSSDGIEGAWDIATMSERGISSCQSWIGEYKHCVIGSVLDPFVGIIYSTSGSKTKQGTKMIHRSIVRFVIDNKDKKPYILIDRMYPQEDRETLNNFKDFLSKKVSGKFEIFSNISNAKFNSSYLPLNNIRKTIRKYGRSNSHYSNNDLESIQSYQDTKIKNKAPDSPASKVELLFEKNSAKKERKLTKVFSASLLKLMKEKSKDIKDADIKLPADEYQLKHITDNISRILSEDLLKSVDKKLFTNSDTYIRRIYYNYFNLKNDLIKSNRAKISRELNAIGYQNKFNTRDIINLFKITLPEVDLEMKQALKAVVAKRKFSGPLPLPG